MPVFHDYEYIIEGGFTSYSSGTFSINSSGQPVVTGTVISSTAFNALTADLATGLSTCVLKDGTQTITANIPMSSFKFTGLAAGSASGNSIRYEQVNGVVTTAGDLMYATGAGVFSRLAIGTARQQLATNSGATAPEWVASMQSILTTTGDVIYASSANTPARLAVGTSSQVLIGGTTPSWGVADAAVTAASDTTAGKVELATTAEIKTGTDPTRVITSAGLKAAIGFSEMFESSELAIGTNAEASAAHGLGAVPVLKQGIIRCKTAELGYSIGDEVVAFTDNNAGGATAYIGADATNIFYTVDEAINVVNRSTFALTGITMASWKIVLRAWG